MRQYTRTQTHVHQIRFDVLSDIMIRFATWSWVTCGSTRTHTQTYNHMHVL